MGLAHNAATAFDRAYGRMITSAVTIEFSVPEFAPDSRDRGSAEIVYARQLSMYLMCSVFGLTKQRIADAFSRHSSTVSHACRLIEQDREDPVLDGKLANLEQFLRQAPAAKGGAVRGAGPC